MLAVVAKVPRFMPICVSMMGTATREPAGDFGSTLAPVNKEYKEEAQCAQKGGRILFFVICGFIKNFFPNF